MTTIRNIGAFIIIQFGVCKFSTRKKKKKKEARLIFCLEIYVSWCKTGSNKNK